MEEKAMVSPEFNDDKIHLKNQYAQILEDYKIVLDIYNIILSTKEELECIHISDGAKIHPLNRKENILFFNHNDKTIYFENMSDGNIFKFKAYFLKKYNKIKNSQ